MMDSTTLTLFDNILKGVDRHPKSGKKKGGMKVHIVMKYHVCVPMVVQLTSAAKHDHYLLKEVHLPQTPLRQRTVVIRNNSIPTSYMRKDMLYDPDEEKNQV